MLVSIILPVYNGESTISDSIKSLLSQTYQNFELIIIDDGSTDNSLKEIMKFGDSRISIYHHRNSGLAKTLNFGISIAAGEFIARQDQDDVSLPNRIEKQVQRFRENRKLVLLGCNALIIDEKNQFLGKYKMPNRNIDLQFLSNFFNPFVHTSVMMKAKDLKLIGGYSIDPARQPPEDFELWNRMKRRGDIENLRDYLVRYRVTKKGMGHEHKNVIAQNYRELAINNIQNIFSLNKCDSQFLFDLQFTNIGKVAWTKKLILFLRLLIKMIKLWLRPSLMGLQSYIYTLKMLGKIIIK
jgi:glycosyltransferase involved in cell wall biosynthesis